MKREIEIIENEEALTVLIPRTGHWVVIVMTGGWCLLWIYMLYLMARDGMFFRDAGSLWYTGAFCLVWVFALKTFLWHVRGKEKITADKEYLRINRLGTFPESMNWILLMTSNSRKSAMSPGGASCMVLTEDKSPLIIGTGRNTLDKLLTKRKRWK